MTDSNRPSWGFSGLSWIDSVSDALLCLLILRLAWDWNFSVMKKFLFSAQFDSSKYWTWLLSRVHLDVNLWRKDPFESYSYVLSLQNIFLSCAEFFWFLNSTLRAFWRMKWILEFFIVHHRENLSNKTKIFLQLKKFVAMNEIS